MAQDVLKPAGYFYYFRTVFSLTLTMMLRRKRIALIAFVILVPVFVPLSLAFLGVELTEDGSKIFVYVVENIYLKGMVLLLALFYGTMLVGEEVENQTIQYLLTRPLPRSIIVLGRFCAYLVLASVLTVAAVAMVFGACTSIRGTYVPLPVAQAPAPPKPDDAEDTAPSNPAVEAETAPAAAPDNAESAAPPTTAVKAETAPAATVTSQMTLNRETIALFLRYAILVVAALAAYGAFTSFLGAVTRWPIVIGVALLFGWQRLVSFLPGGIDFITIEKYIMLANEQTKVVWNLPIGQLRKDVIAVGTAKSAVILLCIITVFLSLTCLVIRYREYSQAKALG